MHFRCRLQHSGQQFHLGSRVASMAAPAAADMAASLATVAAAAPATPVSTGPAGVGDGATPPPRKRQRAPKIDIDAAIAKHMEEVKKATKLVMDARRAAKNEKRRKARLMKKASTLTAEDLERIAVLKRCGLWSPGLSGVAPPAAEDAVPEQTVAAAAASSSAAAVPPPLPPPDASDEDAEDGDEEPAGPADP